MRTTRLALFAAVASALAACAAPEGKTPANADKPATTTETKENAMIANASSNKSLVLDATKSLFGDKDASAVERYFAEPYLQHNPQVPSGLDGLRGVLGMVSKSPTFKYERFRALADGDLVVTHGRYTGFLPQPAVAFDIFRVKDGKIVEHWDGLQIEGAKNPSGHSMVDGPAEAKDLGKTEENRKIVADFLESVLVQGKMDRLAGFFAGDAYVQHNPMVADGLSGLGAFLGELHEKGVTMRYTKVHRVIAEGDLVLAQSEGEFGGKKNAFYDLFRVEGGKIAEHWDVIQEVPEKTASGLGMF